MSPACLHFSCRPASEADRLTGKPFRANRAQTTRSCYFGKRCATRQDLQTVLANSFRLLTSWWSLGYG